MLRPPAEPSVRRQAGASIVRPDKAGVAAPPMGTHRRVQRRDDAAAAPLAIRLKPAIATPAVATDGGVRRNRQFGALVILAKIAGIADPIIAIDPRIGGRLDAVTSVPIPGETGVAGPDALSHGGVRRGPDPRAPGLGDPISITADPPVAAHKAVRRRGYRFANVANAGISRKAPPAIAGDNAISRWHHGRACGLGGQLETSGTFNAVTLDIAIGGRDKTRAAITASDKACHAPPDIADRNGV